jgi:hypothetical protein
VNHHMKLPTSLVRGLVVGALLLSATPGQAAPSACALLQPSELNALLGGVAVAAPSGGSCKWSAPGSARKVMAVRLKASGPGAEMAYQGARSNAGKEPQARVTDLAGVGDKAFAAQTSFGVALFTMKDGRILQLQYWTNARGTAKDVEALKPVAAKAAAAL